MGKGGSRKGGVEGRKRNRGYIYRDVSEGDGCYVEDNFLQAEECVRESV